ncbi:hypothetical protein, partial [Corynebacterium nasicanis]
RAPPRPAAPRRALVEFTLSIAGLPGSGRQPFRRRAFDEAANPTNEPLGLPMLYFYSTASTCPNPSKADRSV